MDRDKTDTIRTGDKRQKKDIKQNMRQKRTHKDIHKDKIL